jgi:hypothetical protein
MCFLPFFFPYQGCNSNEKFRRDTVTISNDKVKHNAIKFTGRWRLKISRLIHVISTVDGTRSKNN